MNSNKFFNFIEALLNKFEDRLLRVEVDIEIRIESLKLEFENYDKQFNKQIRIIRRKLLKNKTKQINLSFKFNDFYLLSSEYIGRIYMGN